MDVPSHEKEAELSVDARGNNSSGSHHHPLVDACTTHDSFIHSVDVVAVCDGV